MDDYDYRWSPPLATTALTLRAQPYIPLVERGTCVYRIGRWNGVVKHRVAGLFTLVIIFCGGKLTSIAEEGSFHFCALGDMPYELPEDFERFDHVIEAVNAERPAFTAHVGDTKAGGTPCSDEAMQRTWNSFAKFDHPLVYTPGDNEWTDCHREAAGSRDPLERLDALRARFFADSSTLGGGESFDLMTQSANHRWGRFVENRLWILEEVVFATLHLVGSGNNNQEEIPGAVAEFRERDAANEAWLSDIFELAAARKAPGLCLFIHANPFGNAGESEWKPGFIRFLTQLRDLTVGYGGPVLLVHGDSHVFRIDKPLKRVGTGRDNIENFTRLEVFGARNMHAVRVDVYPRSAPVFRISEILVEKNVR